VFCLQVSRATPTGAPRSALRGAGDIFSCGTDERNSALGAGKTFSHALIFPEKTITAALIHPKPKADSAPHTMSPTPREPIRRYQSSKNLVVNNLENT
jgi:hypothetical protein